jgi:hypothetical protein
VDDSRFDDTRDYCSNEWDGESVIDVELKRSFSVIVAVMRKDIQECADQVQRLSSDVGNLEDGTDTLTDELGSSVDTLLPVFDEDWDFPRAGAF